MKIILLEKVRNLGELGDTINVKSGYARNFLIPQEKAVAATKENIARFEVRRAELEKAAFEKLSAAEKRAELLKDMSITLVRKALEEGKLFGSINVRDIVEALKEKGVEVEKREINIPTGPIHAVGEYKIEVLLHGDIKAIVEVIVEAEK
jgi:large subunit ribosomal protein L9